MRSRISRIALAVLLAGTAPAANAAQAGASYPAPPLRPGNAVAAPTDGAPPPSEGPQGTSRHGPEDDRYDEVGYAGVRPVGGSNPAAGTAVLGVHPTLHAGTIVEVTALDSGRTILVLVTAQLPVAGGRLIDLSPGAARQLGLSGDVGPVRVRKVFAAPQDQAALQAGQPAAPRLDAPPPLLVGLRRRLGAAPVAAAAPPPPEPVVATPRAAPVPRRSAPPVAVRPAAQPRGLYVQVAALSTAARARGLADRLGGQVRSGAGLYRVTLGPFANMAAAQHARAQVAAQGYPDARIVNAN